MENADGEMDDKLNLSNSLLVSAIFEGFSFKVPRSAKKGETIFFSKY
jgi:hypothetical protein